MLRIYYTLVIGILFILPAEAQIPETNFDSVATIILKTFTVENDERTLDVYKESHLDTNAILVEQIRDHYHYADTGRVVRTHYYYTYDTKNRLGEFFTEQFPIPGKKDEYSKRLTKFKGFGDGTEHVWEKQYLNDRLLVHQENEYNNDGKRTASTYRDYSFDPPVVQTDILEFNTAGKRVRWTSKDEDEFGTNMVRDFSWTYKADTLLTKAEGYVYGNWRSTIYKYKNGILSKEIQSIGYRDPTGKIKKNSKIQTTYDEQGRPISILYKQLKKKTTTIITHSPGMRQEQTTVKDGKVVTTNSLTLKEITNGAGQVTQRTKTVDGAMVEEDKYTYHALGYLIKAELVEIRSNGDKWKVETTYNKYGNPLVQHFFINGKLKKEDIFEYTKHVYPTPEETED